jgi:Cyanobacterial TRADD-N associated 2-Transmembrane domain
MPDPQGDPSSDNPPPEERIQSNTPASTDTMKTLNDLANSFSPIAAMPAGEDTMKSLDDLTKALQKLSPIFAQTLESLGPDLVANPELSLLLKQMIFEQLEKYSKRQQPYPEYDEYSKGQQPNTAQEELIDLSLQTAYAQRKERLYQARATFFVALIALILGALIIFAGIACIYIINLAVGTVTAISGCNGYLAHPFEKEAPWAFTARLFLMVKWDSANDRGGESFSFSREITGVWTTNHQGRYAQAP